MENNELTYITIGELAEKAGVSVRTLQYYDRIGLLKSTLSEGGRRMYTRSDIFRLQQILFFKSFGFSLDRIREKILKYKSASDLEAVLSEQRKILTEQVENLNSIVSMLDTVLFDLKKGEDVSIGKIMAIMQLMKQGNPYAFVLSYFNAEQMQDINVRFQNPELQDKSKSILKDSESIMFEAKELYSSGANPADQEGQKLARRWWKMVTDFTNGDEKLLKTLVSAGSDISEWPDETKDFREVIKNFLATALTVYLKNKNIDLSMLGDGNNE